jgi:hypothetical protein
MAAGVTKNDENARPRPNLLRSRYDWALRLPLRVGEPHGDHEKVQCQALAEEKKS